MDAGNDNGGESRLRMRLGAEPLTVAGVGGGLGRVQVDRQWVGASDVGGADVGRVDLQSVAARIAGAARLAVAMHLEAAVRDGAVGGGIGLNQREVAGTTQADDGRGDSDLRLVSVERTQAASLAILAERVRREAEVKGQARGVAS